MASTKSKQRSTPPRLPYESSPLGLVPRYRYRTRLGDADQLDHVLPSDHPIWDSLSHAHAWLEQESLCDPREPYGNLLVAADCRAFPRLVLLAVVKHMLTTMERHTVKMVNDGSPCSSNHRETEVRQAPQAEDMEHKQEEEEEEVNGPGAMDPSVRVHSPGPGSFFKNSLTPPRRFPLHSRLFNSRKSAPATGGQRRQRVICRVRYRTRQDIQAGTPGVLMDDDQVWNNLGDAYGWLKNSHFAVTDAEIEASPSDGNSDPKMTILRAIKHMLATTEPQSEKYYKASILSKSCKLLSERPISPAEGQPCEVRALAPRPCWFGPITAANESARDSGGHSDSDESSADGDGENQSLAGDSSTENGPAAAAPAAAAASVAAAAFSPVRVSASGAMHMMEDSPGICQTSPTFPASAFSPSSLPCLSSTSLTSSPSSFSSSSAPSSSSSSTPRAVVATAVTGELSTVGPLEEGASLSLQMVRFLETRLLASFDRELVLRRSLAATLKKTEELKETMEKALKVHGDGVEADSRKRRRVEGEEEK